MAFLVSSLVLRPAECLAASRYRLVDDLQQRRLILPLEASVSFMAKVFWDVVGSRGTMSECSVANAREGTNKCVTSLVFNPHGSKEAGIERHVLLFPGRAIENILKFPNLKGINSCRQLINYIYLVFLVVLRSGRVHYIVVIRLCWKASHKCLGV